MDYIVKARRVFLASCVLLFIALHYVENVFFQTGMYFVLTVFFSLFPMFVLQYIKKIKLIAKKNSNRLIVVLFTLLFLLLIGSICLIMLYCISYIIVPKSLLITYKISFFVSCILMILPIIKIPFPSEGIVTINDEPAKKKRVNLISLYSLNSLPREFQADYVVRKMFNNEIINEQKIKVKVKFSSTFFKRIRDIEKIICIEEIIKTIQIQTEIMIEQNNFDKPIRILSSNYSYFAEGEITITYLA